LEAYEILHRSAVDGEYDRVHRLVQILVEERNERPNLKHYAALILAETHPHFGCPENIRRILEEMRTENMEPDSSIYHAALKALSVHPDYLLRESILTQLRQRWLILSPEGWHHVAAGCLRERQVELALDRLEEMFHTGIQVQPWLWDLFTYTFCATGDFDEVLKIFHLRKAGGEMEISPTLWAHVLDTASRALHHEATTHVWKQRVEAGYLNPSSGVCINVLGTAARHGDSHLATDVFRVLGKRSSTLQAHHYEALFESYIAAGDVVSALFALHIMAAADMAPTERTARPLYLHLREDPSAAAQAFSFLQTLHGGKKTVPVPAANALIEAFVFQGDLDAAVETYESLRGFCGAGPTTSTFNAIFRGCAPARRKDLATFLAAEMLALGVEPDALTYDLLILACLRGAGDEGLDDAWRYLDEMRGRGWRPRGRTLMALVGGCCERGDERVWRLVQEMEDMGVDGPAVRRWLTRNWRRAGASATMPPLPLLKATGPDDELGGKMVRL
jgi:hypothetical protein